MSTVNNYRIGQTVSVMTDNGEYAGTIAELDGKRTRVSITHKANEENVFVKCDFINVFGSYFHTCNLAPLY